MAVGVMNSTVTSFFSTDHALAILERGVLPLFYLVPPSKSSFETPQEVPNYLGEVIPFFIIFLFVDVVLRWLQGLPNVPVNDSISSMSTGLMMFTLSAVLFKGFEVAAYAWVHNNLRLVVLPWDSIYTWLLCLVFYDFLFYWFHRAAHEINLFWAAHQIHHSSEYYNPSTALRQSVVQRFTSWFFYLPMALFIPTTHFMVHDQFNLLYQFWIHTEVVGKLGPLEWILNTPSHHRVHHGRTQDCLDRNYGGVFIIWDRLFGTFQSEDETQVVYGLVDLLHSFNPLWAQLRHFYKLRGKFRVVQGFANKLRVFTNGPAWAPGSSRLGKRHYIPKVIEDPTPYQKVVPMWVNLYCVVHFALVLFMSHLVTGGEPHLPYLYAVSLVAFFFVSLTNFGLMFEHNPMCAGIEVLRLVALLAADVILVPLNTGVRLPFLMHQLLRIVCLYSIAIWSMVAFRIIKNQ